MYWLLWAVSDVSESLSDYPGSRSPANSSWTMWKTLRFYATEIWDMFGTTAKPSLSWLKCSSINLILQMKKLKGIWWISQCFKAIKNRADTDQCVLSQSVFFRIKQDILQIKRSFSFNSHRSLYTNGIKALWSMKILTGGDAGLGQEDKNRRS